MMCAFFVIVTVCLIAFSAALDDSRSAYIIRQEHEIGEKGEYNFSFETSDGIARDEHSQLKEEGSEYEFLKVKGSFSYVGPDGVNYVVKYVADDQGFHPEGDHIKVPPFTPWYPKGRKQDSDSDSESYSSNNYNPKKTSYQPTSPKYVPPTPPSVVDQGRNYYNAKPNNYVSKFEQPQRPEPRDENDQEVPRSKSVSSSQIPFKFKRPESDLSYSRDNQQFVPSTPRPQDYDTPRLDSNNPRTSQQYIPPTQAPKEYYSPTSDDSLPNGVNQYVQPITMIHNLRHPDSDSSPKNDYSLQQNQPTTSAPEYSRYHTKGSTTTITPERYYTPKSEPSYSSGRYNPDNSYPTINSHPEVYNPKIHESDLMYPKEGEQQTHTTSAPEYQNYFTPKTTPNYHHLPESCHSFGEKIVTPNHEEQIKHFIQSTTPSNEIIPHLQGVQQYSSPKPEIILHSIPTPQTPEDYYTPKPVPDYPEDEQRYVAPIPEPESDAQYYYMPKSASVVNQPEEEYVPVISRESEGQNDNYYSPKETYAEKEDQGDREGYYYPAPSTSNRYVPPS